MSKPHTMALGGRAVALVENGHTLTTAAHQLRVTIKFVNDMVRLKRETETLAPKTARQPQAQ